MIYRKEMYGIMFGLIIPPYASISTRNTSKYNSWV